MSNYVTSVIRTLVPLVVGTVVSFLAENGLDLDQEQITAWLIPLVVGVYYAVARFIELKVPAAGWLLGVPKQPGYAPGSITTPPHGSVEQL